MKYLSGANSFNSLSFQDLLRARAQFHAHLLHKANVVGTAVGRYLIRKTDPYPTAEKQESMKRVKKPARTLENSEVRPYSWPCVLVFVSEWVEGNRFGGNQDLSSSDYVPPAIYLEDGRSVPICVVLAPRDETEPSPVDEEALLFPQAKIEGGHPVLTTVQHARHLGTLGCLVTDGNRLYALTSQHVAGQRGEVLTTKLAGKSIKLGSSSDRQLGRIPFERAYPGWPGKDLFVNVDVGLIDIDDATPWASSIYGVGAIGPLADLSTYNLSLEIIGCPVRAHGAASGNLYGQITALFYRFLSVGGFEYVADFLIGSRDDDPLRTHPGDSGTVWVADGIDARQDMLPIAIQWGGAVFGAGMARMPFALATNLSVVCRELRVELVREGVASFEYWGAVGHYTIGALACLQAKSPSLKALLTQNMDRISFKPDDVAANAGPVAVPGFVPLADVPDKVWKKKEQDVPYGRKGPENPNHYADMDYAPEGGQSLDDLTPNAAALVTATWKQYYKDLGWNSTSERGLLPFRVWQIYKAMTGFVRDGKVEEYVAAAGILAHYVGDACQPLHSSYLDDGDPFRHPDGSPSAEMLAHSKGYAHGVHSKYEDGMVDANAGDLLRDIQAALGASHGMALVTGGQEAGYAIVELARRVRGKIKPADLVKAYGKLVDAHETRTAASVLWQQFGAATVDVMVDGCKTLAMLWESAWVEGDGDHTIAPAQIGPISPTRLQGLYEGQDFLPSRVLGQIDAFL